MKINREPGKPIRVKTESTMPDGSMKKDAEALFMQMFPEEEEEEQPKERDFDSYDLELRDFLDNYIANTRGGGEFSMLAYGDTIAEVESGNKPLAKQIGGGPGRGKYQFEPDAAVTAGARLKALAKSLGFENPSWNTEENMKDVSQLSAEQQDILFLADKLQDEKTNLKALASGEISGEDFWIKHHWKGNASGNNAAEEAQRRMHYRDTKDWMNRE
mgnify:CR=1 FL=1